MDEQQIKKQMDDILSDINKNTLQIGKRNIKISFLQSEIEILKFENDRLEIIADVVNGKYRTSLGYYLSIDKWEKEYLLGQKRIISSIKEKNKNRKRKNFYNYLLDKLDKYIEKKEKEINES